MNQPKVDAWLRGAIEGMHPALQPAAAALIQTAEEVEKMCLSLTPEELWRETAGLATIGFQLRHIAGATDRLFTYARGEEMTEAQMAAAKQEKQLTSGTASELVELVKRAMAEAVERLKNTPEASLYVTREVGRAKLPATTIGLLFHAAEHAQRHCGQIFTTLKFTSQS